MTLYKLTGSYLDLYEMADDPDVDPEVWFDTLEALGGDIESKAEGYAKVISQLNADAEMLKAEIDRLTARKKAIETSVKNMKSNLQNAMEMTGMTKFKTNLFSFGIQNNPASVVLDVELKNVPEEYLSFAEPSVNKKKLAEDLKAGKDLTGLAHLEQSKSLRIK